MPSFARGDRRDLAYSVTLRSTEVQGDVGDVYRWPQAQQSVRSAEPATLQEQLAATGLPDEAAQLFAEAAQQANLHPTLTVPLDNLVPAPTAGRRTRGAEGVPVVELEVPAPGRDEGQVLLEADDTGVVHWVLSESAAVGDGTDRAGGTQVFRIPVIDPIELTGAQQTRGLTGYGVRKVLHLLRFPIEAAAGKVAEYAVGRWENKHRPHRLQLTSPTTFLHPTPDGSVTAEIARRATEGPFLVFVHGTFSQCSAAFRGLAQDPALAELHQRYGGRVLVFDHPTVSLDPSANAQWLLRQLPADKELTLDLVTHSRGGLVARQLGPVAAAAGLRAPSVRRLVHVGSPNAGTVLASSKRLGDLLDVVTNLFALFPDGTVIDALQVVLEVVKQCAVGVLHGLDGLAAMDPASPTLTALNATPVPPACTVHAVASNYDPRPDAALPIRALNALVDRLFNTGNDLVVPTDGVFQASSYTVPDPVVLQARDAVAHSDYFQFAEVRKNLLTWLM
ncbi:hypothetical protein DN069_32375 [Streptacidiphilus pinicola]|uniref:DUF7379 domain-containing protein n=1 Tax=Streptacidiphilus pinicola TaxID=2219663 RepID=A0A2X0I9D6_9ACTN|nr:hypothetical protein [Streptacidiphilus pinicola]RAG81552.1 hypothetical protein DN069_32375 [Streptacidiphilus pinicola]